jgi:two-component system KDP operon response regulator KdpE
LITHGKLFRSLWGTERGEEFVYLRIFVSQLRKKIENDPLDPQYILTVPRVGYKFADK